MRVIVDCQVLQTSDRFRGMGMLLLSVLAALPNALADENIDISWTFIVNDKLPALSDSDRSVLGQLDGEIISVSLLTHADCETFSEAGRANRLTIDDAVSGLLDMGDAKDTIFFIPAQFSREIYPVFPTAGTSNLMLFHDLIPYLYYRNYLSDPSHTESMDYTQRYQEVYRTDMFVANSQTTADDLTLYLGVDPSRIVPIFGAAADRSGNNPTAPKFAKQLKSDFIFMPSGDDYRKNNVRAVQGLAMLGRDCPVVIPSDFSEESQKYLKSIYPYIIFAGRISDAEFLWLLDNAKVVLFPTEYEGLGMPALEAAERGAVIACSNIPVFAEISPDAFHYFDPSSPADISEVLQRVLDMPNDDPDNVAKKKLYPDLLKRFNWDLTAGLLLKAMKSIKPAPVRKKMAVLCPSPDSYSSVGKYAFEVHAELARFYDIDYFAETGLTAFEPTRPNLLKHNGDYYPATDFGKRRDDYDRVLYNIGNSEFHIQTIFNSLVKPGCAIVHDTRLNGIFDYMTYNGFMPSERREAEEVLDKAFGCNRSSCLVSIATNQRVIFGHSKYAKSAFKESVGELTPVQQIMHPIGVPTITLRRPDRTVVSFAGIISEDKGIRLVSEVSSIPDVNVKIFGYGVLGDSPLLQGKGANVEIAKDLSDKEFQDMLRSTDILINYRPNYHGETSRSALEAMRYGAVVIVHDVGWFSELPDDTVVKLKDETDVAEAVQMLVADPERRRAIGEAARKFLSEKYSYGNYAQLLHHYVEEVSA